MDGTGVELDPEHHISAGVPEALVIARQLEERRGGEGIEEEGRGRKSTFDHVYMGRWAGQSLRERMMREKESERCSVLTKMSPFSSRPGSMVMQILVWLSPCTLLWQQQNQAISFYHVSLCWNT